MNVDQQEEVYDEDALGSPEEPRTRDYSKDDIAYRFTCTDPFGLWHIKVEDHLTLPVELSGQYTSLTECEKAVEHYKLPTVVASDPVAKTTVKPPPIKYKQAKKD